MDKTYRAAIFVFNEADLIDIAGPREVLASVTQPKNSSISDEILRLYESHRMIKVDYIGISDPDRNIIITNDGTKIEYDVNFNDFDENLYTIFVIPGGKGVHSIKKDKTLHRIIKNVYKTEKFLISVCTGAYVLAESGILNGNQITTHERHFAFFEKYYPSVELIRNERYIEIENFIIGGGVTSGFDATLHLIRKLFSDQEASKIAKKINYSFS